MKRSARKVRKLHHDRVIAGFAGATADAFTLFEKFEAKLEQFNGNLKRAAVELAKDWRTDRVLRQLEALLIVADLSDLLVISGSGDVIEPDDGLIAIGSGGNLRSGGGSRVGQAYTAGCPSHRRRGDARGCRDLRLHQRSTHL